MKKGKIALILILLLILSSTITYIILGTLDSNKEDTSTIDELENEGIEDKENSEKEDIFKSKLSGIETTEEIADKKPVAVMFDNHPNARWQSGLKDAEIIYEFPVENPYTRYVGIFLLNEPKLIGPVRSTRPYFVQTIAAYDPIYVRCGGSEDGKMEVKRNNIADLDCLEHDNAFTRASHKKAPNNLYISMESIRNQQKKLGFKDYGDYEGYKFNSKDTDIEGSSAESIDIEYNNNNNTRYEYDSDKKVYTRYKDGKAHIDESDKSSITAKNIIIQQADTKVLDNEGRKEIDIIGSGKGIYITNGKAKEISWVKPSSKQKTAYHDEDGEILFNEGVTWIQVIQQDTDVNLE